VGYDLGVDLGTTYTAAATRRDGIVKIVTLGTRSPVVPSVVFLRSDGRLLVGEPAERAGTVDPDRLGREFKRRMGDQTPILLGGTPQSAAALTARLLVWVLARVAAAEGGPPGHLVLTCPANWGGYKRDVLREAVDLAELEAATGTWPPGEVTVVSEPLATATHYAAAPATARVDAGEVVAVYDLGGGTFDAAVMAGTGHGHRMVGDAIGIEHLGGIDFDDAVLGHVTAQVADHVASLDPADPATVAALAALRRACVGAKVALSAVTHVSVPVVLPRHRTEVRLTRAEFEALIRPTLTTTIAALRRALRTAGIDAGDLAAIVLAGGSSRIPLVAQMLTDELGRPVTSDVHPKHPVALGAARLAPRPADAAIPAPPPDEPPADSPAPVASAWRRARLALAGLLAVAVAALGWFAVVLTDGDGQSEAQGAAPTANERPEPGADGRRDTGDEEPLSRSGRSGDQPSEDAGSASADGSGSPGRSPTSAPDRPATTSRTAPGSPPTTSPGDPSPPGTTAAPGPSSVVRPWQDVTVGDCINDLSPHPPYNVTVVEEVSCATAHRAEVMGVLDKPPQPYPGADELSLEIGEYCNAIHSDVFPVRPELYLTSLVSFPTQQEWDRGIYRLTCFLGPAFGSRTTTGHLLP
jgi:molecular chaperone DnaK